MDTVVDRIRGKRCEECALPMPALIVVEAGEIFDCRVNVQLGRVDADDIVGEEDELRAW